jgi:hypothetical protein
MTLRALGSASPAKRSFVARQRNNISILFQAILSPLRSKILKYRAFFSEMQSRQGVTFVTLTET